MFKKLFRKILMSGLNEVGFDIVRIPKSPVGEEALPQDFDDFMKKVVRAVGQWTMTTPERIFALVQAVRYTVENNIAGDYVECGVWKGGSAAAMAMTLKEMGDTSRTIYLFDTFSGMSRPTEEDVDCEGCSAQEQYDLLSCSEGDSDWCRAGIEEVKRNLYSTGYPEEKICLVQGRVEETIPAEAPARIALLRLDTDWYESTKHELEHLYPLLNEKGILVVDDYGHWKGARKAVDEYIKEKGLNIFLNRIDYTGRLAVKI